MTEILRLEKMIWRDKGSLDRRVVHAFVAVAIRLFFRRIEISGAKSVPRGEPLIFVLNHPNGLIDPALVFVSLPRRVSFLAKSTLLNLPFVGFALTALEALPLYRQIDANDTLTDKIALNQRTFAACFELLRKNRCIALFPEGISNNSTKLLPLKTGAARIALGALSIGESDLRSLKIVPVGLYYTSKTSFRSEALLNFGSPFEVLPVALEENGQPPRAAVQQLSEQIAEKLREVTLNVENRDALEIVTRTEQLFSSVSAGISLRFSLSDELDLRQQLAAKLNENQNAGNLPTRIADYESRLRELGVAPEHLSISASSAWHVFRFFILRIALVLILSPLIIIGAIIHLPAYLLCLLLGTMFKNHGPDDSGGTIKILAAMLFMPLTWIVIVVLLFLYWNWQAALIALPVTILCGYVALRCLEELFDLRGWFAAIWVLLRRRGLFIRLLLERRELQNEIKNFMTR